MMLMGGICNLAPPESIEPLYLKILLIKQKKPVVFQSYF